jgi:uncharacterized protein (DUF1697 family)
VTLQVAFLGGINVGGHRVAMADLRREFDSLGFTGARTFIASGNVVYSSRRRPATLRPVIEEHLTAWLGYPVPTFVREAAAVARIASLEPFGSIASGDSHYVLLLEHRPSASERKAAEALGSERERFEVHGTEVHWLVHGKLMDSLVKPSVLAKALDQRSTNRNVTSLRKLAATL